MLLLLTKLAQMEIDEMNGKTRKAKGKQAKPTRPFEINGTTVTFAKHVDGTRRPEDERELQQLILSNETITFDMTKTKSMDHMWVRLVTILASDAQNKLGGEKVTIIGVCASLRNDVAALGHERYWSLK